MGCPLLTLQINIHIPDGFFFFLRLIITSLFVSRTFPRRSSILFPISEVEHEHVISKLPEKEI